MQTCVCLLHVLLTHLDRFVVNGTRKCRLYYSAVATSVFVSLFLDTYGEANVLCITIL